MVCFHDLRELKSQIYKTVFIRKLGSLGPYRRENPDILRRLRAWSESHGALNSMGVWELIKISLPEKSKTMAREYINDNNKQALWKNWRSESYLNKYIINLLICDIGDTTMNKADNLPVLQLLMFHWGLLVYEQ